MITFLFEKKGKRRPSTSLIDSSWKILLLLSVILLFHILVVHKSVIERSRHRTLISIPLGSKFLWLLSRCRRMIVIHSILRLITKKIIVSGLVWCLLSILDKTTLIISFHFWVAHIIIYQSLEKRLPIFVGFFQFWIID